MRMPIVKLITFGAGGQHFKDAAERLVRQSKDFPAIDISSAYTDSDLPADYHELFRGLTGYGYYSWKPYLINAELSKLEPNDILVYIDAGCELNVRGVRRFDDYLSYTSRNDVLLFEMQHPNRFWSKNHPKLVGYPEHHFRNQLVATVMFLKNNERTRQFVRSWLNLCSYEGGALLTYPEADEPQIPGFQKHRCDQSALSICAYLHDVATIPDETWFHDWSYARDYPILALRNKTGIPTLKKKLKVSIFRRIKAFIKTMRS